MAIFLKTSSKYVLPLWLVTLAFLPVLSIYGRSLQTMVQSSISKEQLALIIFLIILSMIAAIVYDLVRCKQYSHLWHLAWFLPLFIVYPLMLPIVEERVHFIIFGLLGYLTVKVFNFRYALAICVLISAGDELLQWFLPDRVGDWHDVMINCIASISGAILSYVSNSRIVH